MTFRRWYTQQSQPTGFGSDVVGRVWCGVHFPCVGYRDAVWPCDHGYGAGLVQFWFHQVRVIQFLPHQRPDRRLDATWILPNHADVARGTLAGLVQLELCPLWTARAEQIYRVRSEERRVGK